jgi:osmoprotectant transport system permease protein
MSLALVSLGFLDAFTGAIDFIFNQRESTVAGDEVGGLAQIGDLTVDHLEVSAIALAGSLIVAMPIGVWLGHHGRGELLAVAIGNAGRAVPELALIAFMVAFVGVGLVNVSIALLILGIPPILTNSFVAIRQVDRDAVEAARGMGMSEPEIVARVELPLAVPTLMSGVYGDDGVLAGGILVAVLALAIELTLAGIQRLLTPRGLRLERAPASA